MTITISILLIVFKLAFLAIFALALKKVVLETRSLSHGAVSNPKPYPTADKTYFTIGNERCHHFTQEAMDEAHRRSEKLAPYFKPQWDREDKRRRFLYVWFGVCAVICAAALIFVPAPF